MFQSNLLTYLPVIVLTFGQSCKKESDGNGTVASAKKSEQKVEVQPITTDFIIIGDLGMPYDISHLAQNEVMDNLIPEDFTTGIEMNVDKDDTTGGCMDKLFRNPQFEATDGRIIVKIDKSCDDPSKDGKRKLKRNVKMYAMMEIPGYDFSKIDSSKGMEQFDRVDFSKFGGRSLELRFVTEFEEETTDPNSPTGAEQISFHRDIMFEGMVADRSTMSPLKEIAAGLDVKSTHYLIHRQESCSPEERAACSPNFYEKIEFQNVSRPAGQPVKWYGSGVAAVVMNDWNGTVTYTGPDTPPTYQFTDKSGKSILQGTLSQKAPSVELNLQNTTSKFSSARYRSGLFRSLH